MKIAVLSANLGGFDPPAEHVGQELPQDTELIFHCFNDKNFKPVAGLTPRMQYRICKLYGWELFPGYDYYLWIDGAMAIQNPKTILWFLDMIKDSDFVAFEHPKRKTVKEEVDYIEWMLHKKNLYISKRYQNGFHKEQLAVFKADESFNDDSLYASTIFMYKNTPKVHKMMKDWWYFQSRYWTCDQVQLPYVLQKNNIKVTPIHMNVFRNDYFLQNRHNG